MLKKIILGVGIASLVFFAATPALAQFGLDKSGTNAGYSESPSVYSTISTVISMGLSLAGLVFLGIMFYGGLRWMTARGDEEKATKAKEAIFEAMIGFILVILSYGISAFVFSRLIK
ncbi:MAG: hypothetical protein UT67_C0005G0012 [Candidatus Magasanikbacteria bacterium GW2011_GWA2_40_10]|uniref:DUF4134 domain-containing protein n=1 Tax=Candidatus Magasanikbacteria bacterium GW2011_GWA2_40_10 TaxID=1619037 RepID=A0A0G0SJL2_9BACT|nr:MAG: hypothetical protein UT67_C0005G0012 [Candidatus Magasanikbacteria bacterium GW2011_GWA2_40_10]